MNKWIDEEYRLNATTIQAIYSENGQRGRSCTWCLHTATTLGPKPSVVAAALRTDAPSGFKKRWSGETRDRNPGNQLRGKL